MDTPPGPGHLISHRGRLQQRGGASPTSQPPSAHLAPHSSQPRPPGHASVLPALLRSLSLDTAREETPHVQRESHRGPGMNFRRLASSSQMYSERQQAPSPAREVEWGSWPQPGCDREVSTCLLCNCMQVCDVSARLSPLLGHGEE